MADYSKYFPTSTTAVDYSSYFPPDLKAQEERRSAIQAETAKDMQRMADPTTGMSGPEKFVAGYGSAVPNLVRGVGQNLGMVSREDVAEARKRDAPLMNTGAGAVGSFAGNVAALAPTAFIPGANTTLGAGLIGSGVGAIQPSASTGETAANVFLGGGLGAGGQAVAGTIANTVKPAVTSPVQDLANRARQAGFAIPPSQIPNSGVVSRGLEGFAGKLTTAQQASAGNQALVNKAAQQTLGLTTNVDVTPQVLNQIRSAAGRAYEAVKQVGTLNADNIYNSELTQIASKYTGASKAFPGLGGDVVEKTVASLRQPKFGADAAVDAISVLRDKADVAYRQGDKGLGKAFKESAAALEGVIERNLPTGSPLLEAFKEARTTIAKTYSVQSALNETTSNVSGQKLAAQLAKGKPLTGPIRDVAELARAFPKAFQSPEKMGSLPGTSPLDWTSAAMMSAAGGMLGGPAGASAGVVPFLRPLARSAILSKPYQNAMGSGGGMLSGVPALSNNYTAIDAILRRAALPGSLGLLDTQQ